MAAQADSWPEPDQERTREIPALRTGMYHATPEELQAIDEADQSGVASDEDVAAAFPSFRR